MSLENLETYLSFAVDVAKKAGNVTMKYFLKDIKVDRKEDETPVTIADRETEEYIREKIEESFPEHAILGEEAGESTSDSPLRWVIDPIDGTQSFIRGVPLYTVLLALEYNGVPVVGVIHNPPLQETVSAATGLGAFYNGVPCQVSSTEYLAKAWVQVTDYADLDRRRPAFAKKLLKESYSCRTWGDAYGYLLVATGRVDVMIDPIMSYWDIAPLKPIITESGGVFTDLDGNDNPTGVSSIACNSVLHKEIMKLVH
ncbi:MAG: inositol monophosphatase family protein [Candidatus Thorarchaeota archaeon]|nr:MAG: inositol monophosphatase family protein [Candidatus Thorarchaeota archaeon]